MMVSSFVDELQSQGRYTFHRKEIEAKASKSQPALKTALSRLVKKGRLLSPKRGFYVLIPLEYRATQAPPVSWFLDDLMIYMQQPYYVGLLSAAALHGASHQRVQEFQVVTPQPIRPILLGHQKIRFVTKQRTRFDKTPTLSVQTATGSMNVSTPEATAFDLVRYFSICGYFNHVATVLNELAEAMNPHKLIETAEQSIEFSIIQRLGYLFEMLGASELANPLLEMVQQEKPQHALLRPGKPSNNAEFSARWALFLNEEIEIDE